MSSLSLKSWLGGICFLFLYMLAHFACDGRFQICMNMWCTNGNYKTVPSLSHGPILADTIKESLFSSQLVQPKEKFVFF